MRGRKRTPAHVRAITGQRGVGDAAPGPSIKAEFDLSAPAFLSERAAQVWPMLAGVLSERRALAGGDELALVMLCEAFSDWQSAKAAIADAGGETYTTTTESGATLYRTHPAVAQRNDAWRRVQAALAEFGLTPASREKVARAPDNEADKAKRYFS